MPRLTELPRGGGSGAGVRRAGVGGLIQHGHFLLRGWSARCSIRGGIRIGGGAAEANAESTVPRAGRMAAAAVAGVGLHLFQPGRAWRAVILHFHQILELDETVLR